MSHEHLYKVVHPFNRANLFYEVRQDQSPFDLFSDLMQLRYTGAPNSVAQMADIHEFITTLHRRRGRPSSGIIYCRTKAICDELSGYLRGKGLNSRPYHRGIA